MDPLRAVRPKIAEQPKRGRKKARNFGKSCHFAENVRIIIGHYVSHPFIFIHIAGSISIFNIFIMGFGPVLMEFALFDELPRTQAGIVPALHAYSIYTVLAFVKEK